MALFALAILVVAGCGGPEIVKEPPRVAGPVEEEPISQVGQGGTARLVLPDSLRPVCLNPYLPECRGAEALTGVVLESPLVVGPSSGYRPLLAEAVPSYEAETLRVKPLTVEVRLRSGVNFSDDKPLTSEDVKWTYESAARLARGGGISPLYSGFGRVERVETPDERTARIVFREPYAGWRDLLTAPILPRHVYEDRPFAKLKLDSDPIGSGPFLLKDSNEGLKFVDTPRYWVTESPLPNLDGLKIEFSTLKRTAGILSANRADFGFSATMRTVPETGDLLRAAAARSRVETLLFNSRRLESRSLRQTISRAVDRESIADRVGTGVSVARSLAPDGSSGSAAWQNDTSTVEKNESGIHGAGTLRIIYPKGDSAQSEISGSVASDLRDAGFRVETRPVEAGELYAETLREGNFDLALYTVISPAELEAFAPLLPPSTRRELEENLGAIEPGDMRLQKAQDRMAEDAALLPLFVLPDAYAWSSALYGPRPDTPYRGLAWNIREWGFYK